MEAMSSSVREDESMMADELYKAAMRSDFLFYKNSSMGDEYFLRKTWASNNNILHIAVRHGSRIFLYKALERYPQLIWERNLDGNTPLHFAAMLGEDEDEDEDEFWEELTDNRAWRIQNSMGNTPLHVALIHHNLPLAQFFVEKDPSLAEIVNASMEAPLHLALKHFPHDAEYPCLRSIWGITSTEMKEYANKMGVIAALVTTITFTAAFAVPGGFHQEKGTPLLMSETSFQVFIFFDIIAMCLSMMVLFCRLWMMAAGSKSKELVLLDFSIILLQASFYTTLVTFMTGIYATTHAVKLWVAVVALVLCSMLILLMQKCLVMRLIIPSGKNVLIFLEKGFRYARNPRQRSSPRPVLPISSH